MLQEIRDQKQWNNFLLSQPTQAGIFLQSWQWGEFQEAVGRKVYRLVNSSQSTVHSIAQVIELPLPFGKKYWYIPRGTVIDGLVKEAKQQGVLFLRIEPLQQLHATPVPERSSVRDAARYTLHATRSISPPQTLLIDLTQSEDELLAGMHEKTRYNVRLASKRGVVHSPQSTVHSFEEFWKLLQETAKRDGFRTHERSYYEKMLLSPLLNPPPLVGGGRVGGTMHVRFHATYHGSVLLAVAIVAYFGDTATYLHGASSYEHRALMGPYALHWEIMREAKRAGYKFYDFWGVSSQQSPSPLMGEGGGEGGRSSWFGITRFKLGFGGQVIDYPGTFDLPFNRLWYAVYRLGRFCKI